MSDIVASSGQSVVVNTSRKTFVGPPTYWYVRPSGGSYGLEDGTSFNDAWNGFGSIGWSIMADYDILIISGTHNEGLVVGGNNIIIEGGVIDVEDVRNTCLDISSMNNITINNLSLINAVVSCLNITGTSSGVVTNNITASGSGNQGIQHLDTVSAIHNNATCDSNVDDGISGHDSAIITVNGGTFSNNAQGINTIEYVNLTINGNPTFSGNSEYDVWITNAALEESNLATINNSSIGGLVVADQGAKLIVNNCTLDSLSVSFTAQTGYLEANNSILTCTIQPGAVCVFNDCLYSNTGSSISGYAEFNRSRVTNDSEVGSSGSVKARHTLFEGGNDMQLDFLSGATCDLAYCIFYNVLAGQFMVALRTGSNITTYQNCTQVGVANAGRGLFAQETNTAYNNIYQDLDIGAFRTAGTQTLENCAFWNNNTDKTGTFTSNDEVTTNPLLTDPASLDFSLGVGSSCIGTGETRTLSEGIDTADWGNGIDETPTVTTKEQGASWDIGAYIS